MSEPTEESLLAALAERVGIANHYHDIAGTYHATTNQTKRALLSAMGFAVQSAAELVQAIKAWDEAPWRRLCDPVRIIRAGSKDHLSCTLPLEDGRERDIVLHWRLSDETGAMVRRGQTGPSLEAAEVRFLDGRRYVRVEIALPDDVSIGYYTFSIQVEGAIDAPVSSMRLIVAPEQCYVPQELEHHSVWGFALQLYSLSSARNWGCGDFTDLNKVVEWAAKHLGAHLIGLNPLHALRNTFPHHTSPYAPFNRLYLNELYIDLERLPEFFSSEDARRAFATTEFQAQLKLLRDSRRVDYDSIASAKRTMLDFAYRQFLKENYRGEEPELAAQTPRAKLLERFIETEGEPLELYAIFQTLEEERRLIQSKMTMWQDWPAQFRSPGQAAREYGRRHRKRVRFFQYIQWVASEQLKETQRLAKESGMAIGLYNDLALGAERNGAESWMYQRFLIHDADCGAPPDAFAPEGQNWGMAPWNPIALKESGYEPIIRLLRNNLRFGGAIRLDHVMALARLFWIPRDRAASEGTYVHYPFQDLLAIVALESARAKNLVIGEDLGTVPDYVREQLAKSRIFSYRVLYFERHEDGALKGPEEFPEQSLAVVTTHDLPTLTGFWSGEDLRVRAGLSAVPDDASKQQAWDERQRDKGHLLCALKKELLLPPGMTEDPSSVPLMTPALCQALHLYLARTSSLLVLANLEDALEELSQTNLPGTVEAHPNWTRKYAVSVDGFLGDPRLRDLAAVLRSARRYDKSSHDSTASAGRLEP
ncbi:4-alpha-glucanotransferase [Nitrospira sp. KM1]|uniref:4-alpha-glucanotransferase n=1 Tax=Nitrospira sp. KM1 TaxID=1936990 RepID=UPI0015658497|nr:4-alpha-glucanotransferase [Nitrospira sp. KM1]